MNLLSTPVGEHSFVPFSTGPLRASVYNVIVPGDAKVGHGPLIYNTLSGAVAELAEKEAGLLTRFKERGSPALAEILVSLDVVDSLFRNCFLVERDKDEPGQVALERLYWRQNRHHLDLTVAPTLACNFACTYCFEKKSSLSLSRQDVSDIIMFFERVISPETRSVVLHWYGGEPTLRVRDIRQITPPLIRLAQKFEFDFLSEIYTNAWKLDEEMCKVLRQECQIRTLMISLDGPREIHNRMRRGPKGIGDFDIIMKKIELSARYFDVKLRIHCHKDNEQDISELLAHLYELGFHQAEKNFGNAFFVHFSKLYDFSEECKHVKQIRLPHDRWGELQIEFMEQAQELGFRVNWLPKRVLGKYCNAQREYAYVIAPRGYIFKCYRQDFADGSQAIGRITDSEIPNQVIQGEDATDRAECQTCLYLPLCSGSCPNNAWSESPCTHLRGNLEQRMVNLWKQRLKGIKDFQATG